MKLQVILSSIKENVICEKINIKVNFMVRSLSTHRKSSSKYVVSNSPRAVLGALTGICRRDSITSEIFGLTMNNCQKTGIIEFIMFIAFVVYSLIKF